MKISVIVPVYNAEKYITQCLESIVNQTLKDIEILLVDDSSTDGSLAILKRYEATDGRIQVIENQHEGEGAASARNAGLAVAQGEYISFLDADDYFALSMLEEVHEKAIEHMADIVMYDAESFDAITGQITQGEMFLNRRQLPTQAVFSAADCPDTIFTSHFSVVWTKLFRRAFIQSENLQFQPIYHTDDILFVSGAMSLAKRICILPKRLVHYRANHATSQSTNKERAPLSMVHACMAMKVQLQEKGVFAQLQNGYANFVIHSLAWDLNLFERAESFRVLYEALATKYLEELALESSFTKNIVAFDGQMWIEKIKQNDALAYVYYRNTDHHNDIFFRYTSAVKFPKHAIAPSEQVILYGGGQVGQQLYIQNLVCQFCRIVAWVDKSSMMPHPIESIDALQTTACDKVLIAIQNESVAREVAQFLKSIGFSDEQIVLYSKVANQSGGSL